MSNKELIDYIPLSKGRVAIIDAKNHDWLSQWRWSCNTHGYAKCAKTNEMLGLYEQALSKINNKGEQK